MNCLLLNALHRQAILAGHRTGNLAKDVAAFVGCSPRFVRFVWSGAKPAPERWKIIACEVAPAEPPA